jgi:hypothetical protein
VLLRIYLFSCLKSTLEVFKFFLSFKLNFLFLKFYFDTTYQNNLKILKKFILKKSFILKYFYKYPIKITRLYDKNKNNNNNNDKRGSYSQRTLNKDKRKNGAVIVVN